MDAGRHPLIDVVTNAEVVACRGRPGAFKVRVRRHPRYVREDVCVACGLCVDACPQVGGNEFDVGLKARKAIYRPFPQSVPSAYVIDREACLNGKILVCDRCDSACDVDAIDFDMQPEEMTLDVGAILVAVGFSEFDARQLGNYGYGRFPNVITSLELERMLNASGVTEGHIVRPSDMKTPKRIIFIQCVGARGEGGRAYCSRFCCMNAVKDSMLIRQHDPEVEDITILYTDLRAFGKGFDDFVERSHEEKSATYLRGRPAKIERTGEDDRLEVFVEDTLSHQPRRLTADLVVLSVAAAPNEGAQRLAKVLGVKTDSYGFVARRDPAVSAVESTRDGIYVCGSASGPQVIPECVAQASAVAARAQRFLTGDRVEEASPDVEPIDVSGPPRVGVLVCHCGINIAGLLDVEALADYARALPDVVASECHLFACSSAGQEMLVDLIREHGLNRVVVAACTPRTHEPVFREALARVGFNPYLLEMVNIRDQCSWVHSEHREAAQEKAKALIRMGVARARHLEPLQRGKAPMTRAALVIGGGVAGIQAAGDLARQGFPVVLAEKSDRLGGRLAEPNLMRLYPNMRLASDVLKEQIGRLNKSGARVLLETTVQDIRGYVGNFQATLASSKEDASTTETIDVGAVVLAIGADLYNPAGEFGYGTLKNVITSLELERSFFSSPENKASHGGNGRHGKSNSGQKTDLLAGVRRAAFILCVGSRDSESCSGCSRYCCPTAIKQALMLNERGIDTTILYRDIRTVSTGAEEMYRQARGAGVLFVRVPPGQTPQVIGNGQAAAVRCHDELLGRDIEMPADLVVLGVGMRPRQPDTDVFHEMLKASVGLDGYFLERHPELAPVETAVEGVLVAGTAQGPKDIVDTIAQASAAAAKASVFLAHDQVVLDPAISVVEEVKCRACGACVDICEFHAPELVDSESNGLVARINAPLCKGCGTCASWCPSGAITARHFTDRQVNAMIDAFFDEPVNHAVGAGGAAGGVG